MFARLATAFSREGGDSKGLGANANESPGQRDAANVPSVEYTLTEAFPPLQSEEETTATTCINSDQGSLPPKEAAAVDDGACSKRASSNPSTPPPSSPILKAQQQQQHSPADDKSQQLQQHKPAPPTTSASAPTTPAKASSSSSSSYSPPRSRRTRGSLPNRSQPELHAARVSRSATLSGSPLTKKETDTLKESPKTKKPQRHSLGSNASTENSSEREGLSKMDGKWVIVQQKTFTKWLVAPPRIPSIGQAGMAPSPYPTQTDPTGQFVLTEVDTIQAEHENRGARFGG